MIRILRNFALSFLSRNRAGTLLTPPFLQIRLVTTQHSSPDTIRLWIQRAGPSVPLDIEIFLRVTKSSTAPSTPPNHRHHLSPSSPTVFDWTSFHHQSFPGHGGGTVTHHVVAGLPGLPGLPVTTPLVVPLPPTGHHVHDLWGSMSPSPPGYAGERFMPRAERYGGTTSSTHWGYVAIFYLIEQMHRWERFVFRFDKQFPSIGALKSISGESDRAFNTFFRNPVFILATGLT